MEKRYLYIVLTRTNTVLSNLIRFIKNDEYTHAAISLDIELNHMYSFGRRNPHNPFIGCFKKEDINEGVYKFCKTLPGAIIEVEVSGRQFKKAEVLLNNFISNGHLYTYNYKGLVHSLFNKPRHSDYSFLCSEFVYYILKQSGIADFKVPGNMVRPQSLLNVDGRIILRGDLKEIMLSEHAMYANDMRARRLAECNI